MNTTACSHPEKKSPPLIIRMASSVSLAFITFHTKEVRPSEPCSIVPGLIESEYMEKTTTDHASDPAARSSPWRPSSSWRSGLEPPAGTAAPSGTHNSRCWHDTAAPPWPAGSSMLFTVSNNTSRGIFWLDVKSLKFQKKKYSRYCCTLHHPFPSPSSNTTKRQKEFGRFFILKWTRLNSLYMVHKTKSHNLPSSYQILKFHIQVLADSELCVRYGLVKVCVQIVEHLHDKIWLVRGSPWSQKHIFVLLHTHRFDGL